MTNALSSVVGFVTIGQAPRPDVVPEMAAVIGPGVEVREAGALDGLNRSEIEALAPTGHDEILVTRLQDGSAVFLRKEKIVGLVEQRIAALERGGATLTALLCTGGLSETARHPAAASAAPGAAGHTARAVLARPARRPHPIGTARVADRGAVAARRLRPHRGAAVPLRRGRSERAAPRRRRDARRRGRARGDGLHGERHQRMT
jgi:AroM protein